MPAPRRLVGWCLHRIQCSGTAVSRVARFSISAVGAPERDSLDLRYAGASLSRRLDDLLCQLASHDAAVRAVDATLEQAGSFHIGDDRLERHSSPESIKVMAQGDVPWPHNSLRY